MLGLLSVEWCHSIFFHIVSVFFNYFSLSLCHVSFFAYMLIFHNIFFSFFFFCVYITISYWAHMEAKGQTLGMRHILLPCFQAESSVSSAVLQMQAIGWWSHLHLPLPVGTLCHRSETLHLPFNVDFGNQTCVRFAQLVLLPTDPSPWPWIILVILLVLWIYLHGAEHVS